MRELGLSNLGSLLWYPRGKQLEEGMFAQFPHSLLMHSIYYSKRAIIPKKIKLFAFPKREFAPPRKPVSDAEQETVDKARKCIVSLCGK